MLFLTLQGKCITGKFDIFIMQSNPYRHLDHYYGQFALSLRKESLNGNVEKTGTSQQRKTNRFTGLLIFRAVADPRNSGISAKSREIRQKYFQIHVGKTYLILILAIRPVLFTPNVQI